MPAAPIVLSATKSNVISSNEQIVAALNAIHQDHGTRIGSPRILYTRGTPSSVKVELAWQVNLDDPTSTVLTSFSVTNLQRQLQTALPGWHLNAARLATPADLEQTSDRTIPVLIHTEATTVLQSQAPRAADIKAGFEAHSRSPLAENGHWVGAAPRIVRQSSAGANRTFAAWLYEWPDTPWVRANLVTLVEALQYAVNVGLREETQRRGALFNDVRLVAWDAVTATTWSANFNGPLAWWRDGSAAITRTMTEFPGVGSLEYVENPIGPDSAATRPNTSLDRYVSAAKTVGAFALAGLGLYFLGPAIGALASRAVGPAPARANPIGFVSATILRPGDKVEWWPESEKAAASYENVLKIGARGAVMHDPKGRVRKINGVDSMAVRFESGAVQLIPIRDLGIPDELRWDRHRLVA